MSWLFQEKEHSADYSKYRPTYPSSIYDLIFEKLEQSFVRVQQKESNGTIGKSVPEKEWKLAVDVGCGPGKGTLKLCDYFDQVVGVDCSQSQIGEAMRNKINEGPNNVSYICCNADCISEVFEESSVDLITVAQAIHWFDRHKFYEECKKILRPGGLLVAYGYGMHWFEDQAIETMKQKLFYPGKLKNTADVEIFHLENHYEEIFLEFIKHFKSAERNDSFLMDFASSLDDYLCYISTLALYRKYKCMNPNKEDPLKIIFNEFKRFYPHKSSLVKRKANIFVLFGSFY